MMAEDNVAILVPFQITGNGGTAKAVGEHAVLRQQLLGVLMTNHGERIMFPSYGANVQGHLFDATNELVDKSAADDIAEQLNAISSLLRIGRVWFSQDPTDPSSVFLNVQYSVNNNDALLKVKYLNGIITDEDAI
jgi:phage baseplate assembly protein W